MKIIIAAFVFSWICASQLFAQQKPLNTTTELENQHKTLAFKVAQLFYNVPYDNLLAILKNSESSSFISVGKTVDLSTIIKERSRIFRLLSPVQLELKMNDIKFDIDTTRQKGFCNITTVVKSIDN